MDTLDHMLLGKAYVLQSIEAAILVQSRIVLLSEELRRHVEGVGGMAVAVDTVSHLANL